MSDRPRRLFLIDGMAIAYRAYFAFIQRPLMTSDGRNVSAVYGFVTFLNRIINESLPDYLAVAFDTKTPTFRHEAYAEYKATREKMPEDMVTQLDPLREVIRAHRIPLLEVPGFEADDIIGTLARKAEKEGLRVFLVSGDKDFMQLVSPNISLMRPAKQGGDPEVVGFDGVREKFGVTPDKVIEVLALTGDSSDNVPGVPGIGEKTAIPLIQKYGGLEALYRSLDDIPQKGVRAKLELNRELAFLSRTLVTIHTDAPVDLDLQAFRLEPPDRDKLRELYRSMEFRSLLNRLDGPGASEASATEAPAQAEPATLPVEYATITTDDHTYRRITTLDELKKLAKALAGSKGFVFDTETTSTDALRAELVGVSFSLKEREAFYVPIAATAVAEGMFPAAATDDLAWSSVAPLIKGPLEDASVPKAGHNIKYDILVMSRHGINVAGADFDTMVASYLLREDAQHNMDAVSREYLGYSPVSFKDIVGQGKLQRPIREVDPQALSDYSCEDADITYRLWKLLAEKLKETKLDRLATDVEMPLVAVLADMERRGITLDTETLAEMSKEMEQQIKGLTLKIHELAGGPFNLNSTQQLGSILFTRLGLPPVRKTKTGFSTDVGVLESLRHAHPIVESLLEYRQLSKLKSTYVDALPQLVHPDTGRVHTSYSQTVAATGRLSSSDPNLQNIPIRTEAGKAIRRAFIVGERGSVLLSADYSQIELRVMAHIAGDEGLAEAFRNNEDIHATTAARVFGVPLAEVSRDMRRKAKAVNFGIMYGSSAFGLANNLEISQTEAKEIIDRYFQRFPKVQQYIHDTIATATKLGYVQTLLGRRRYLPDLRSQNRPVRQNAERQAINMPIQGTSADMIKIAMVRIQRAFAEQGLTSAMLLQVHDELLFEVRKKEETAVRKIVEREMVGALPLSVPIQVEMGTGRNWLDAH
ncbi:MAG: DNA polymerase I [Bacteroidetes bacterium]|jgi:DNA polymerase-1|nr:DNA polymerase I [Bacteroidota bacterium]